MTQPAANQPDMTPDVIVAYGSETRLLLSLFERDCRFIRIYNSRQPQPRDNCRDINSIDQLEAALDAERQLLQQKRLRIAFVGAAFRTQKELLISEPLEELMQSVDVNVASYVRLARMLLPHMIAARYGTLIYLSSFRATTTARGISVYAASKAFGEKFFEVIGKEYGRFNISSVSLRLGYFDGRMLDPFKEEELQRMKRQIAVNRLGTGQDVVAAIDFVLANRYLNGGVIDLQGGLSFD